jgi:rare lipoprotein A
MFQMRAKMISVGLLGAAVMLPIDYAEADQLGHASWYSLPSNITANGEQMNPNELTAAHRSLPFGTRVLVENLSNGRSVVVRINDRGPFIGGRIIDLSKAAAASIGMLNAGTAKVRVVATDGGSALAELGENTVKAKTGAASGAAGKVEVAAKETPKATATASKASRPRSVAAKASVGTKYAAKRLEARGGVKVASASRKAAGSWRLAARSRLIASSNGIGAAAAQASDLSKRRSRTVVAEAHPYAILGATPGFMKPSRSRKMG